MLTPILIGLSHSVESDHVIAVSNLIDVRHGLLKEALRGASWGLGHTVSVMVSAFILLFIKNSVEFSPEFSLELLVGIMMVVIGVIRLFAIAAKKHMHPHRENKYVFFNVGIIHGLAGSGTIAVLLTSQFTTLYEQTQFLFLFGLGTIIGMGIIAAFFTRLKFLKPKYLLAFSYIIASVSVLYGIKIIYEQLYTYIN
ncbi:hypothetical protein [Cytophaga hutchinsonii]|jgi:nickel/cobalt exporter|uniref:Urease accessory protein n=1 Tax=Cytophaga hutchinsonii (strain ATCC 33406 / DSM 1761 / CIP 103989 / NBRC 15051 / NCIMB 9469 / D465) TaxID=269798 RepID=A0A6N4SQC8_CYTH3|nr:hypothetical protein [Cytophaga hutchinsonii]ABG58526.1 conserved hypothetical protein; possible urease accessory protein [Cytophaga hutchinsonii ATCC 33406]SFX76258.1 hypothetical protein SAMN04487930_10993 [Cytophaga hutchinsonii ATCC 33406]